jgi:hypothetical protein
MPVDQPDAWVRTYLEDVFNGHNLQSLNKYMTENFVSNWLGDRDLKGREAWRAASQFLRCISRCRLHPERPLLRR